jgi:hypothetical protein
VRSGLPSFGLMHTDFGNFMNPTPDGYAPLATIKSCMMESACSPVIPTFTCLMACSKVRAAMFAAFFIPTYLALLCMSLASFNRKTLS